MTSDGTEDLQSTARTSLPGTLSSRRGRTNTESKQQTRLEDTDGFWCCFLPEKEMYSELEVQSGTSVSDQAAQCVGCLLRGQV